MKGWQPYRDGRGGGVGKRGGWGGRGWERNKGKGKICTWKRTTEQMRLLITTHSHHGNFRTALQPRSNHGDFLNNQTTTLKQSGTDVHKLNSKSSPSMDTEQKKKRAGRLRAEEKHGPHRQCHVNKLPSAGLMNLRNSTVPKAAMAPSGNL